METDDRGYETIPSAFGDVIVVWSEGRDGPKVSEILLPGKAAQQELPPFSRRAHPDLLHLVAAINRYLEGEDVQMSIDSLDQARCSPFQWMVLMAERTIPRGHVTSYSRLAARVGSPRGFRAVGSALARNPFPLVVPCHRTVRGDGSLGGFGGGLPMKKSLLEMEGVGFDARGRVRPEFFWDWEAKP